MNINALNSSDITGNNNLLVGIIQKTPITHKVIDVFLLTVVLH